VVDVFETSRNILLMIFVLAVFYILGIMIVGGFIGPMFRSNTFRPPANSTGISQETYLTKTDFFIQGMKWVFYIILAIPFVYLIIKLLYEREETSVYGGG
jgi:hypothetical protein